MNPSPIIRILLIVSTLALLFSGLTVSGLAESVANRLLLPQETTHDSVDLAQGVRGRRVPEVGEIEAFRQTGLNLAEDGRATLAPEESASDPEKGTFSTAASIGVSSATTAPVSTPSLVDGTTTNVVVAESTRKPDKTTTSNPTSTTVVSSTITSTSTTVVSPTITSTSTTVVSPTITQTSVGPIVITGENGVVLENLSVSNPSGPCIRIVNSSNIVVKNSQIGPCGGRAITVESSSQVTVENVEIRDTSTGLYVLSSQGVVLSNSSLVDAGRNFVQFDKVTGSGNRISGNVGRNVLGGSNAEDLVSIYKSSGTAGSPILISGNSFSSGGPSGSGSGIMVGDAGGSYIVVKNNTLVNPGQVGIGVAGGTNIGVLNNTVSSSAQPWSNVGIYVWNQTSGPCGGIEVRGNSVQWYNSSGSLNPAWNGGNCGTVEGWASNGW